MTYGIYFDNRVSTDELRQALESVYAVPAALVCTGRHEMLTSHPGPDPIALITPADGPFGHEFGAGAALAEHTGATPLELARAICRATGARALIDDGSPAPDYWFLVAADGSFGRVMTDPDNDNLTILYALEPIPGEPGLKVVPPPDWAKTW
ncbi:MAG: hypothetical protein SYR96_36065 [Actinomycetota bacterium]|nr:hypothetical protein [Actinomycetota bacterium]